VLHNVYENKFGVISYYPLNVIKTLSANHYNGLLKLTRGFILNLEKSKNNMLKKVNVFCIKFKS